MKRFYKTADVAEVEGGWQARLDGRAIKTVRGSSQIVPARALAEALAREWAEQGEEIDPARFVMRDMADFAIDMVQPDPAATIAALARFAESDTLCYRADPDEPLFTRQQQEWEPLLAAIEAREGISFTRVSGIIPRAQPAETLAHLRALLAGFDHFTLAALQTIASLAASLSIALLALEDGADAPSLWRAANLEEEWQAELWGRDDEAEERRARKREEFLAAVEFVRLTRFSPPSRPPVVPLRSRRG